MPNDKSGKHADGTINPEGTADEKTPATHPNDGQGIEDKPGDNQQGV